MDKDEYAKHSGGSHGRGIDPIKARILAQLKEAVVEIAGALGDSLGEPVLIMGEETEWLSTYIRVEDPEKGTRQFCIRLSEHRYDPTPFNPKKK